MKATFDRKNLLAAVQAAASVSPRKTPKEILKSIKLETVDDGAVQLYGTDLTVGIRCSCAADVGGHGAVLLPAIPTLQILRSSTADSVAIEATKSGVKLSADRSKFEFQTADPAEFPSPPEIDTSRHFVVDSSLLAKMAKQTVFATDPESVRYALGGVLFELAGDRIRLVATDGRQLALAEGVAENAGGATDASGIVPATAVRLLERLLAGQLDTTAVVISDSYAVFDATGVRIYSRLVEGKFPAYEKVLPKDPRGKLAVTAGVLRDAVRQAAIVTDTGSRGLEFLFGEHGLHIAANSAGVGSASVELDAHYDGPQMRLVVDSQYLLGFLKTLSEFTPLMVGVLDDLSPVAFRADGYLYIVMPMASD